MTPTIIRLSLALTIFLTTNLGAQISLGLEETFVSFGQEHPGDFPVFNRNELTPVWCSRADHVGVQRAARDLQADIERVSGRRPEYLQTESPAKKRVVIIGTAGKCPIIDSLIQAGRLPAAALIGKWETFVITTLSKPTEGIDEALIIAGSDKRGTIYGIYELSEQLGVSPWYWWADVTPVRQLAASVRPGLYSSGEPAVRYRGIFINDEAPCLTGWAKEKFGGLNSQFYTRVFELLLRLRANYLWPAMWDNAFNEDDPESPRLADEYGIVMGTSHHEPMMRAHKEWTTRRAQYGNGKWNYASNAEALQRFFREGVKRNGRYENLVTIGMRGDGDEGMVSSGSIDEDMRLLRRIFEDQRRILSEETGVSAERIPQLWALFTEVQKFYEHGLRPPDDVTLLWTDDNTGNLRRLPTLEERQRSGGAGIYYHFDMHGGPYAYQWVNTNPLPKIAEQMTLAHEYGANRIWIANVGDIKPLEIPIEFFLRMAWNPRRGARDQVSNYLLRWAEREFGRDFATEAADIVARYTKYNGWRKPEIVVPESFSPVHYREAETVLASWRKVSDDAARLHARLPDSKREAFFQLVLHPAKASAIVNELNIVAGFNRLYASQGRISTNGLAARARELFRQDQVLTDEYNHRLSGGKWNHLMDQAHLGQYSWEPPRVNSLPPVSEILATSSSRFGLAIDGAVDAWPGHFGAAELPAFDSFSPSASFFEIFPEGDGTLDYTIAASAPWIKVAKTNGAMSELDHRHEVDIDWAIAPEGASEGTIEISGNGETLKIGVKALKAPAELMAASAGRFATQTGILAFAASATSRRMEADGVAWLDVPDYGRGAGAVATYPVTAPSSSTQGPSPTLDYDLHLPRAGLWTVTLIVGPVMDFAPERGVRLALGFDESPAEIVDLFANKANETFLGGNWSNHVTRDNARYLRKTFSLKKAGPHTLRISRIDPGVVIQKVILHVERLPETYFGPPERAKLP